MRQILELKMPRCITVSATFAQRIAAAYWSGSVNVRTELEGITTYTLLPQPPDERLRWFFAKHIALVDQKLG